MQRAAEKKSSLNILFNHITIINNLKPMRKKLKDIQKNISIIKKTMVNLAVEFPFPFPPRPKPRGVFYGVRRVRRHHIYHAPRPLGVM